MKLLWHFFLGAEVCHHGNSMKRSRYFVMMLAMCGAQAADLTKDLEQIAQQIGGRAGVSAVLIESGEHVALHGDQPFFMASVVKFPVALRVLQLVDEGKL